MTIQSTQTYGVGELMKDMWAFMRPYRSRFWLATILRITSDLAWLYPAWALGQIANFFAGFHGGQPLARFWWLLAGFAGAGLYRFTVIEVAKFSGYQVAERIGLDSKLAVLKHLFRLDLIWHDTMNSGTKLKRVEPTIETGRGTEFSKAWRQIEAKDLTFAYRERNVLKDVNLTVKRGEKIGIVGPSGAGKSTLFKILLKLYENYRGEVKIDGMSLKDIERDSYIARVAVVMQDTELFDLSLKQNVTIVMDEHTPEPLSRGESTKVPSSGGVPRRAGRGGYAPSDERLQKALAIAHLDELLPRLPQGVDTLIGEKGIRLSGGEKQRLGIARAVYKNPEILFLDEATSHLDANSERKIQDSLHDFFKEDLTAIVIAHRLSTIKEMDRVIVFDKGRIVEEGKFDTLLKQQGLFYRLWEKQKL